MQAVSGEKFHLGKSCQVELVEAGFGKLSLTKIANYGASDLLKIVPIFCFMFDNMNLENKVEELIAKVELLNNNLNQQQSEIALLKAEMEQFKKKKTAVTAPQQTDNLTLENFVGLKLIHFVGIIVLIIGLSIGVKYAIDINLISPALRIVLAYVAGIALFLLSLKLRKKYDLFSAILFSGAMASAYFTTYAAFTYYNMMPRAVAFGIMLIFTLFTVYSSLKYNRAEIAMLGLVGAYGIPFFVRGNSDNIIGLFSYMLLINLGVLFLSFKKYWLSLNYLSFFTTWIIFFSCLYLDQEDKYNQSAKIFAITFYVLFVLSTLGFKLYRKYIIHYADSIIIILNTVFVYFALSILHSKESFELHALLALIFAVVYAVAGIICRKLLPAQQFLSNTLLSVGIAALILYFPLQFDGFTITIIWVLIAVALFIAGMFYQIKLLRFAAICLFGFTIFKLLFFDSSSFSSLQKIVAYIFTGTVLLLVSFLYQRFKERIFGRD